MDLSITSLLPLLNDTTFIGFNAVFGLLENVAKEHRHVCFCDTFNKLKLNELSESSVLPVIKPLLSKLKQCVIEYNSSPSSFDSQYFTKFDEVEETLEDLVDTVSKDDCHTKAVSSCMNGLLSTVEESFSQNKINLDNFLQYCLFRTISKIFRTLAEDFPNMVSVETIHGMSITLEQSVTLASKKLVHSEQFPCIACDSLTMSKTGKIRVISPQKSKKISVIKQLVSELKADKEKLQSERTLPVRKAALNKLFTYEEEADDSDDAPLGTLSAQLTSQGKPKISRPRKSATAVASTPKTSKKIPKPKSSSKRSVRRPKKYSVDFKDEQFSEDDLQPLKEQGDSDDSYVPPISIETKKPVKTRKKKKHGGKRVRFCAVRNSAATRASKGNGPKPKTTTTTTNYVKSMVAKKKKKSKTKANTRIKPLKQSISLLDNDDDDDAASPKYPLRRTKTRKSRAIKKRIENEEDGDPNLEPPNKKKKRQRNTEKAIVARERREWRSKFRARDHPKLAHQIDYGEWDYCHVCAEKVEDMTKLDQHQIEKHGIKFRYRCFLCHHAKLPPKPLPPRLTIDDIGWPPKGETLVRLPDPNETPLNLAKDSTVDVENQLQLARTEPQPPTLSTIERPENMPVDIDFDQGTVDRDLLVFDNLSDYLQHIMLVHYPYKPCPPREEMGSHQCVIGRPAERIPIKLAFEDPSIVVSVLNSNMRGIGEKRGDISYKPKKTDPNQGDLTCPECFIDCRRPYFLAHHARRKHDFDKPFLCAACDEPFQFRHDAIHHYATRHCSQDAPPKWTCQVCHEEFESPDALSKHYAIDGREDHPTIERFICDYCGYMHKQGTPLRLHSDCHDAPLVYCKFIGCDYRSRGYKSWLYHTSSHVNRTDNYLCQHCGTAFRESRHLREHTRIHTQPCNHFCPFCQYATNRKSKWREHILWHHRSESEHAQRGFRVRKRQYTLCATAEEETKTMQVPKRPTLPFTMKPRQGRTMQYNGFKEELPLHTTPVPQKTQIFARNSIFPGVEATPTSSTTPTTTSKSSVLSRALTSDVPLPIYSASYTSTPSATPPQHQQPQQRSSVVEPTPPVQQRPVPPSSSTLSAAQFQDFSRMFDFRSPANGGLSMDALGLSTTSNVGFDFRTTTTPHTNSATTNGFMTTNNYYSLTNGTPQQHPVTTHHMQSQHHHHHQTQQHSSNNHHYQ